MTIAIEHILSDPSFETSSNEAKEARSCALILLSRLKDERNKDNFGTFSTELCTNLEPSWTCSAAFSANRDKMWRNYFLLRSSDEFVGRWKTFYLQLACQKHLYLTNRKVTGHCYVLNGKWPMAGRYNAV